MTREIKFRAIVNWKIIPVFAIKYRSDWIFVLVWDEISSTTYNINDIVLQQFTWLKDKAWKEIYEWDVIDRWNNAIVCFNNWRLQPVYDWWTSEDMEDDFYLFANRCFVIGNIYENKDLLSTIK